MLMLESINSDDATGFDGEAQSITATEIPGKQDMSTRAQIVRLAHGMTQPLRIPIPKHVRRPKYTKIDTDDVRVDWCQNKDEMVESPKDVVMEGEWEPITDLQWTIEDCKRAVRRLEAHWINCLNQYLLGSCERLHLKSPKWLEHGCGGLPSMNSFVQHKFQTRIQWRVDQSHALIMGHIDIDKPHMMLEELADVVHNFDEYRETLGPY
jgi:hypothetical protein